MMQTDAAIIVSTKTVQLSPNRMHLEKSYRWEGGNVARACVADLPTRYYNTKYIVGQRIQLGALRLVVVDVDWPAWDVLVTNDTRFAVYYIVKAWLSRVLGRTNQRLIATLCVWGLADWPFGVQLSWNDVHLVKKLRSMWRRTP